MLSTFYNPVKYQTLETSSVSEGGKWGRHNCENEELFGSLSKSCWVVDLIFGSVPPWRGLICSLGKESLRILESSEAQ